MAQSTYQPPKRQQLPERRGQVAGGLVMFAAVMLIIGGVLDVFRGVMGLVDDELVVKTPDYTFEFSRTGWGWIHLVLGGLAVLIGLSLFKARVWARVIAVALAGLLLLASFLSLPHAYYPIWSIVLIAVYAFIIWALCVVRREDL